MCSNCEGATNEHNDDEELKWDEEDDSEEPKAAPKHEVEKYLETLDSPKESENSKEISETVKVAETKEVIL